MASTLWILEKGPIQDHLLSPSSEKLEGAIKEVCGSTFLVSSPTALEMYILTIKYVLCMYYYLGKLNLEKMGLFKITLSEKLERAIKKVRDF